MSLAQPQQAPERRVSPVPPINAPTNNPFRKGAGSPALTPPIRNDSPSVRPSSRNPFLDNPFDVSDQRAASMSPPKAHARPIAPPGENEALLSSLTLEDKPPRTNMPPPQRRHHPSQSQESTQGGRRPPRADTLDIFADPPAQASPERRRPRRNSESSVVDKTQEEEQRKRRERRHRERPKDSQGRPIPSSSKSKKPSRRLDVIDKLDVTSIYGTGLFHHDGPFDALNPHRKRRGQDPMSAFAKDSLNNSLGGSGPVNKNIDLNQFHGRQEDSFKDFNMRAVKNPEPQYEPYAGADTRPRASSKTGPIYEGGNFNPGSKVEPLHGEDSAGLGTSTFFEGTPATRTAIQRRESESEGNTLTRKKSLAQKIRGMSNSRPRRYGENGDYASPEPRYERTTSPEALSAGGRPRMNERNPFFQDYEREYEKKGASIRIAEQRGEGEPSRQAPAPPLTRSVTEGGMREGGDANAHANAEPEVKSGGGGFLSRVKSLRGGGRGKSRPERLQ